MLHPPVRQRSTRCAVQTPMPVKSFPSIKGRVLVASFGTVSRCVMRIGPLLEVQAVSLDETNSRGLQILMSLVTPEWVRCTCRASLLTIADAASLASCVLQLALLQGKCCRTDDEIRATHSARGRCRYTCVPTTLSRLVCRLSYRERLTSTYGQRYSLHRRRSRLRPDAPNKEK